MREAMRDLAEQKPAWGYRLLHGALRLRGYVVNHKKLHRLYREEKLALRKKSKQRLKCEKRGEIATATRPGQRWTMDFIHDTLADGRSFRTLNLTDTFTRQCLGQEVDTSLSGYRVTRLLERAAEKHGLPAEIQVDNGPEFRSKELDLWAYRNRVKLVFIDAGKPTQNGHLPRGRPRASTGAFVRSVWIRNGSAHWHKHVRSSRRGGSATIARDHTPAWAICHRTCGRRDTISSSRMPCPEWYTNGGKLNSSTDVLSALIVTLNKKERATRRLPALILLLCWM
jgi:transposase InsO family protein